MKKLIVIGVVGLLFAFGCKKPENNCDEQKLTAAFVFDYPDTVSTGEAFNLGVNYIVENSCGDVGTFDGERDGNTLEVRLNVAYKGCDCVSEFEEKALNYPVIFEDPGTYELKFWVAESTYETYVIYVEE